MTLVVKELGFEGRCELCKLEVGEKGTRGTREGSCVSKDPERGWRGGVHLEQKRREDKAAWAGS